MSCPTVARSRKVSGEREDESAKKLLLTRPENVHTFLAPSVEDIRRYGVRGKDFIISCNFDGVECSYKDFFKWQSQRYGNCFTFNSPLAGKRQRRITNRSGRNFGLRASLNIEPDDYLFPVTPSVGARLYVHPRSRVQFPESGEGIDLTPMAETTIGVKRKHLLRMEPPYGACNASNEKIWMEHFKANYSSVACSKLCLNAAIEAACGCAIIFNAALRVKDDVSLCNLSDPTERVCVDDRIAEFRSPDPSGKGRAGPGCSSCAPSCSSWSLDLRQSGLKINRLFQYVYSNVRRVFLTEDFCSVFESRFESSNTHVHVYLDSLEYVQLVEIPTDNVYDLYTRIGGIWGLFVSYSAVTCVEWFEVICYCVWMVAKNIYRMVRRNSSPKNSCRPPHSKNRHATV